MDFPRTAIVAGGVVVAVGVGFIVYRKRRQHLSREACALETAETPPKGCAGPPGATRQWSKASKEADAAANKISTKLGEYEDEFEDIRREFHLHEANDPISKQSTKPDAAQLGRARDRLAQLHGHVSILLTNEVDALSLENTHSGTKTLRAKRKYLAQTAQALLDHVEEAVQLVVELKHAEGAHKHGDEEKSHKHRAPSTRGHSARRLKGFTGEEKERRLIMAEKKILAAIAKKEAQQRSGLELLQLAGGSLKMSAQKTGR